MKYAIHLSTFTKKYDEDLIPFVKKAAEIGYQGVELPLLDPLCFEVTEMNKTVEENNLKVLSSTGLNENTDISSTDSEIRRRGIEHLIKCIDITDQLGGKQLTGVNYSPWGVTKSKEQGKENISYSIDSLKQIADYAEQFDITIGLEILNRYEGYMINTVKEGLDFIDRINKKNVGLHFDTFHAHIEEEDMYEAIILGGDKIVHVHFCENTRGVPLTGQVHWGKVSRALKQINYNRWISIENFVNTNSEVGNSTMIWRQLEESGTKAAELGFVNMKKIMERE